MKTYRSNYSIAVLAILAMFVSCSGDGPKPPEEKPIVFETKSMYWQTDYDDVANRYNTICSDCVGGNDIVYVYADGKENPNKLSITKFTIETAGNVQEVDISELTRQASESPDGYFNVTLEGVTLKYEKPGELTVSYGEELDEVIYNAGAESRFYNISLSGDENYSSEIRIEDLLFAMSGLYPIPFDLTAIEYPTDRDYNFNGAKIGFNYFVYLPADACEFPIISKLKHFYLLELRQKNADGNYSKLPLELLEEEEVERGWFYVKENSIGRFTHKEEKRLNCEISANTTGEERVFMLVISTAIDGINQAQYVDTNFHIIQAAK